MYSINAVQQYYASSIDSFSQMESKLRPCRTSPLLSSVTAIIELAMGILQVTYYGSKSLYHSFTSHYNFAKKERELAFQGIKHIGLAILSIPLGSSWVVSYCNLQVDYSHLTTNALIPNNSNVPISNLYKAEKEEAQKKLAEVDELIEQQNLVPFFSERKAIIGKYPNLFSLPSKTYNPTISPSALNNRLNGSLHAYMYDLSVIGNRAGNLSTGHDRAIKATQSLLVEEAKHIVTHMEEIEKVYKEVVDYSRDVIRCASPQSPHLHANIPTYLSMLEDSQHACISLLEKVKRVILISESRIQTHYAKQQKEKLRKEREDANKTVPMFRERKASDLWS